MAKASLRRIAAWVSRVASYSKSGELFSPFLNPKTFGVSGKIAIFEVAWYSGVVLSVKITVNAKMMLSVATTAHRRFFRIRQ